MKYPDSFFDYIGSHLHDDPSRLLLSDSNKEADFDVREAVAQIVCRKKALKKLPAKCSRREFIFPDTLSAEQASSEILADFHVSIAGDVRTVADLTAGLGVDAMAFAGKGCSVTAVERDPHKAETLGYNAGVMGIGNMEVVNCDASDFIQGTDKSWDLIYIDPARRSAAGKRTFAFSDCSPDIIRLMPELHGKSRTIIVKASPMLDVSATMKSISGITDIYVISLRNECKEMLVKISTASPQPESSRAAIHAIDIGCCGKESVFSIQASQMENFQMPEIADASEYDSAKWIYEPNSSLMKTGAWGAIAARFPSLKKINVNTHLFVSDTLCNDFPGKIFEIYGWGTLRSDFAKSLRDKSLNITTRNFPFSSDQLSKKLHIRQGSSKEYLIAATIAGERHCIFHAAII